METQEEIHGFGKEGPSSSSFGEKEHKSFEHLFGLQNTTILDIFLPHFYLYQDDTTTAPERRTISLRPLGLVCVSRVQRLVKKKKKKKKEKETDLRERRETTTTRKKRRGEERLRRLGF